MSRCLVTGGAGFIGSHLVDRLVADGHEVTVLDDFSNGLVANLEPVRSSVRIVRGDVCDLPTVREATEGQNLVFHQAARGSVPRSVVDPITTNDVNVSGTLNVLVAARDAGVERLIYASSSSVYGDTPTLPKVESMPPQPLSPYALSKLTAEEYCRIFHRVYGLETVSLRYFNVFGPRQRPDSQYAAVIPRFIAAMLAGESPVVNGDGMQSRDFTFVSNNVDANLLAATAPVGAVAGKVFNVACDDQITLLELIGHINEALGTTIEPQFGSTRAGDVKHSRAGIDRARVALGYEPRVGFAEGLRRTVEAAKEGHRAI